MEEEYYDCSFMLESGITDFWVTNVQYKNLIQHQGIATMSNEELKINIGARFESLNDIKFENYMLEVDSINVEKDISPDREGRRDNEAQVVLLWRFKKYWSKSISAKLNLSWIYVNKIFAKYKQLVKRWCTNNLILRRASRVIRDDQVEKN